MSESEPERASQRGRAREGEPGSEGAKRETTTEKEIARERK